MTSRDDTSDQTPPEHGTATQGEAKHNYGRENIDGLVILCMFIGAILVLSILTRANPAYAFGVIFISVLPLAYYLKWRQDGQDAIDTTQSAEDPAWLQLQKFSDLIDALPRPIAVLNRDGKVMTANPLAKDMLSPNMVGRPISAYLRNSDLRARIERAFECEPGSAVETLTVHILQPSERYVDIDFSKPVSLSKTDSKDSSNHPDILFAILSDRTQAVMESEMRADFLANASHELKTPIASIKGYIETLRGHAKDDPKAQEKFLEIMLGQSERMENLITDLLSLRKIESSAHIAPLKRVDLREALSLAQDTLSPLCAARQIKLDIQYSNTDPIIVFGETDECVQLFINLIENAVRFSPDMGQVSLYIDKMESWSGDAFRGGATFPPKANMRRIVNLAPMDSPVWRVIISDNGPGISRIELPRIGERFYRVAKDTNPKTAIDKGTGLGIAIVKHISVRHRAGLFVRSLNKSDDGPLENGKSGTQFCLIFAAQDIAPPSRPI